MLLLHGFESHGMIQFTMLRLLLSADMNIRDRKVFGEQQPDQVQRGTSYALLELNDTVQMSEAPTANEMCRDADFAVSVNTDCMAELIEINNKSFVYRFSSKKGR